MNDFPVEFAPPEPYDSGMEKRVTRLEEDMRDVKSVLSRLEPMIIRIDASLAATLPHLATKVEVTDLRAEMNQKFAAVDVKIADLPTKTYMWAILGVLITAYGAGLAALGIIK
jgi:hypothetical protein